MESLLLHSRRYNEANGITGALLFNGWAFAQVLEGRREEVESLFGRICKDKRHSLVVLLETEEIAERGFLNWSMAYSGPAEDGARYSDLNLDESQINPLGVARRVYTLLKKLVEAHG